MICFSPSRRPCGYNLPRLSEPTTDEVVKKWIGANHYDDKLPVAANIAQAAKSETLPTSKPITLKQIVFDGETAEIFFPENVTLDSCLVNSNRLSFHQGTARAVEFGAEVDACGEEATAYAMAEGTTANAMADGSTAIAVGDCSTANAMADGSMAIAGGDSSTANAMVDGSKARAWGYSSIANAMVDGSTADASGFGSIANAMADGSSADTWGLSSIANAMAPGSTAIASKESTIANATVEKAVACADASNSIAIARHPLAVVKAVNGRVIPYKEFIVIKGNLDKFSDHSKTKQERADAAYAVGMAYCDGKGVRQSDTVAKFFLSAAHDLKHLHASFELGELFAKKRAWHRQDLKMANDCYAKDTPHARNVRELARKYALWLRGIEGPHSALLGVPKDVIDVIKNFLSRL